MKNSSWSVFLAAITRIGVLALLFSIVACSSVPPLLEMAWSRVHIGDEREQAVQALSDAWYYAPCPVNNGAWDYFLYGGRTRDTFQVVSVHSTLKNGKYIVDFVGSDEPKRVLIGGCIPDSVFEKEEK